MVKVIFDTDIGTDVDDLFTLGYLLAEPEVELLGVCAAYGDTALRANLALRVLELAGRPEVPVAAGNGATLTGAHPLFWPGHEGRNAGVTSAPSSRMRPGAAEDFMLGQIERFPGEVVICATAPFMTVARAIQKAPGTMRQLKRLYVMAGAFRLHDPELRLPAGEHNIRCDPEAAQIVFSSGLPITMVPLDVTETVPLTQPDFAPLRARSRLMTLLDDELATWMDFLRRQFDAGRDHTYMHDPLTAAAIVHPELITRSLQRTVGIECHGQLTLGASVASTAGTPNVQIAAEVDSAAFHAVFMVAMERLAQQGERGSDR